MFRLFLALSSLSLLSAFYHDGRGNPMHFPRDLKHPLPLPQDRWRRGLAAAPVVDSNKSEDRENKRDWRGHKDHKFIADLPEEARKEFFAIKMDEELSRAEKREKIMDWAQENNVEDEISAYFTAKDEEIRTRKEAMAAAVEDLPEAYEKISAIFDDSSISRRAQKEKMEEMMVEYSEQLKSLLRAALPCGGRRNRRMRKWQNTYGGSRRHGSRKTFAEEEQVEF